MSEGAVIRIRERIGADRVKVGTEVGERFLHDQWVMSVLRRMEGRTVAPAAVVSPGSTEDVAAILEIANAERVPVVPSGLRSGVCGGAVAPEGAIVVDLSGMDDILDLAEERLTVTCQSGVNGGELETWLRGHGYTMGHFPQSIDVSSVGGWVATRASGQFSTKYGNVEDMLLALEAVLPGGRVVRTKPVPRSSTGPDLRAFFLGSEGTVGIVTEATFRVHPLPEAAARQAISFPDVHTGLDAIRDVLRRGWQPAVLRLYDAIEAGRNFAGAAPEGHALLLVYVEGPKGLVDAEVEGITAVTDVHGGEKRGSQPVKDWLAHRNRVPGFESFLEKGIVVDTIEVAVGWDRIRDLYDGVTRAMQKVEGLLVVSGHTSHGYTQGTNLYFTFAARPDDMRSAEELYFRLWSAAMEATLSVGGTISHHHGIGRLRTRWMSDELGEGYELLRAVKHALDPNGIMNPGALFDV